jgi:catechol 2,3-dioxygenase-like lactoylglutathione lyase family enzyme
MDIVCRSSVIFCQDIAAARSFYVDLLGQEVAMDFGPNVGFVGGFAIWQVDHAIQTIYGRAPESVERLGRRNCELYFETADLEAASDRLSEAGVEFIHPPREHPWAQRAFRVYDPDGHIVELGEPMSAVIARLRGEGMSAAAVAERTGMPIEIVKQIAGT